MHSPFQLLSLIVALPFFGLLFVLTVKDDPKTESRNAFNVCIFTILANMLMIWRVFMVLDEQSSHLQLQEHFDWLSTPDINIMIGVDVFSLLLILALHLAVLIGLAGVRGNTYKQKSLMVFTLLFLSMATGFFVAADIFSFYLFFEAMLLPVFMIIGMFGEVRKTGLIYRYFLYNFLGAIILFSAVMIVYHFHGALTLEQLARTELRPGIRYYVWGAVFLSFLSRIPVWPFHYWISSINSSIRNPLAFIITAAIPLTGIYGFIRFLPVQYSQPVAQYIWWVEIIGAVTMLFIALIGFSNKDSQYKLFAYITVYYIMYLLGVFNASELIILNIGYSLFSFVLIAAALEVLTGYIYHREELYDSGTRGFLCKVKRLSFSYSYLTIAAVGMPLSAVFLNNFLILSRLLSSNIKMGMVLIASLTLVGAMLLEELFRLKVDNPACPVEAKDDISKPMFWFMLFIMFILLMTFIKPLWFVIDE